MAAGAQGYAYDALRRTAHLARTVWGDEVYAALLEQAAGDLRDRFQRDFWMPEHAFPALALDGDGRHVDALASDAGHLLWSGLLDKEYGELVGRRLLEPDFFSGWGVRTLASGQPAVPPAVVPPRLGLAARQRADHAGAGEVRPARRGPYGRPRAGRRRHRGGAPAAGGPCGVRARQSWGACAVSACVRTGVPLGGGSIGAADGSWGCLRS